MPLFSRRKPIAGQAPGAPGRPADEADTFTVPAPIFAPEPEAEPVSGPPAVPVDAPDPAEPRDPNAPPIPGTPAAIRREEGTAVPASEPTAEEVEARTARFARPGSRRGVRNRPSARSRRREARAAAARASGAPPTTQAPPAPDGSGGTDLPTAQAVSTTPVRGTGVLSAPALLAATIVIGLLAVLLVFLFQPGATAWAVVGALILIGIVQLALFYGTIVVITRKAGRRLGVIALVVLIAVNPLTATMVRGIASAGAGTGLSAGGSGGDREHDPIWDTYPGSAYVDAKDTLDGPTYEAFADQGDTMLEEMRTALTAEFGFEWVERQPAEGEIGSNGYGGESMLYSYDAPVWQTTTTVRTFEEKSRVVELIRQVLLRYGVANLDMQNAPSSWREPGELTERYGGETIDTQALWDLHTYDVFTRAGSFQASIVDLDLDAAGTVAEDRQFDVDYYDMAAEGVELHLDAYALLKEADRADYLEALKPYDGLDKPE